MANGIFDKKSINFELIDGLPDHHGTYLFLLEDGTIREGYYSSFPHPNCEKGTVKWCDQENEWFYYEIAVGWFKRIE
jgi:hypothetical protein